MTLSYAAFDMFAVNGNLLGMELFMVRAPDDVPNMIKADNYSVFRQAAKYNHTHITNRLLPFPTVLRTGLCRTT